MSQILGGVPTGIPLEMIARHVMPGGNASYRQKPEIPTYIFGSGAAVEELLRLVPAPVEAWCNLIWPRETKALDDRIAEEDEAEEE